MKSGGGGGRKIHRRRRRRREAEVRIAEIEHRPVDIDDLVRRRRRHVVVDDGESRRRLQRARQDGKTAARIPGMRAVRIAPQIGPVGLRRVGAIGATPGDRLAPRRDDGAHALGQRVAGIGDQEILVAVQRVAIERRGIGILRAEIADRPVPDRGGLIRRRLRGGASGARSKNMKGASIFAASQGTCAPLRGFVDAQPHAVEHIRQRQAAGADHLRQRLGVGAIRPLLLGRDRARRGIEGDQHVRFRIDQRQAAGERLAAFDEGLLPRRIEHDDVGLQRQRRELA